MKKKPKFIELKLKRRSELEQELEKLKQEESSCLFNDFSTIEEMNEINDRIQNIKQQINMINTDLANYRETILNGIKTNSNEG